MNLIFDRTQADVTYAAELNRKLGRGEALTPQELADWSAGLKGAYNATDMNRVDAAVREIGAKLTAAGYPVRYTSPVPPPEPEYTPLSYIESSGTQYIDTGYKPNSNTRVVLSGSGFSLSGNNQGLFGARTAFTEDTFCFLSTSSAYRSDYGTANDSVPQGTNLSSYFLLDKDKNVCKVNGTVVQSAVQTFTCSYNLYICAINTANTVDRIIDKVKIYYCQIYDNGVLVRDFVPAKKSGIVGLYDRIEKKMYANSGTGEFIVGNINDYTALTYIQSGGTQYIDTGYKPNNNTRVICKVKNYQLDSANPCIFGSRLNASTQLYAVFALDNGYRTDYNTQMLYYSSSLNVSDALEIDKNKNECILNGTSLTNTSGAFSCQQNLYLFACNTNNSVSNFAKNVQMEYCQIYDNGTIVRDYIPAIQNGRAGLYDKVESKMYYSNGTDDFIAGEAIIKPDDTYEELGYIESTGTQYIDTGFLYDSHCKIELDAEYTTTEPIIFVGAKGSEENIAIMANPKFNTFVIQYYGNYGLELNQPRNYMVLNKNVFTANGKEVVMNYKIFAVDEPLTLSALIDKSSGNASYSKTRIYICKLYDSSGVLQRDFVPARQNGEIGLYDKANKKFYPNAGTGEFLYGEKPLFNIGNIINYDIWRTYLDNVKAIRDAYYTMPDTPKLPEPTAPLSFDGANAIEKLLYDVQVLYNAMLASYRKCGTFQAGNNIQRLPLQRSVT